MTMKHLHPDTLVIRSFLTIDLLQVTTFESYDTLGRSRGSTDPANDPAALSPPTGGLLARELRRAYNGDMRCAYEEDDIMTAEEVAWNNARVVSDRDPEHDRQDKDGMPMWRERFNRPQAGGWAVNEHGDAEAFRVSGPPAMGDRPLSSVDASYYLPSEIGKVA